MKTERRFFSKREAAAINTFIGDLRHDRKTRAHLLARCNDDPVRVLEYFRNHVTREDFDGSDILQRIAKGLKREGFAHKIHFKPSAPITTPSSTPAVKMGNPMDIINRLPFADVLQKRGLIKYAIGQLQPLAN